MLKRPKEWYDGKVSSCERFHLCMSRAILRGAVEVISFEKWSFQNLGNKTPLGAQNNPRIYRNIDSFHLWKVQIKNRFFPKAGEMFCENLTPIKHNFRIAYT